MRRVLPSDTSVLEQIAIDLQSLKTTQPSKRSHYRAVANWLTQYHPTNGATNLEQVRGGVEAFHHLCEVRDWSGAKEIINLCCNTPIHEKLHHQLGTWGYQRERILLYEGLLGHLESAWDVLAG